MPPSSSPKSSSSSPWFLTIIKGNDFVSAGHNLVEWNDRLSPSSIQESSVGTVAIPHRHPPTRLPHSPSPSSADPPPPPQGIAPLLARAAASPHPHVVPFAGSHRDDTAAPRLPEELLASSSACLAPAAASAAPSSITAGSKASSHLRLALEARVCRFDNEASTSPCLLPLRRRKLARGETAAQRNSSSRPPRCRIVLFLYFGTIPGNLLLPPPLSQAALFAISPHASS
jgi:hypothetical protein